MSTIKRFEDILAWQEARLLLKLVYHLTSKQSLANDFVLRNQLHRATISVSSNIAEGFARKGSKEFARFLWIAKGSLAEVQSQLYLALDLDKISQEEFDNTFACAERCAILVYKLIDSLITED